MISIIAASAPAQAPWAKRNTSGPGSKTWRRRRKTTSLTSYENSWTASSAGRSSQTENAGSTGRCVLIEAAGPANRSSMTLASPELVGSLLAFGELEDGERRIDF